MWNCIMGHTISDADERCTRRVARQFTTHACTYVSTQNPNVIVWGAQLRGATFPVFSPHMRIIYNHHSNILGTTLTTCVSRISNEYEYSTQHTNAGANPTKSDAVMLHNPRSITLLSG